MGTHLVQQRPRRPGGATVSANGFTLMECLVALAVAATALAALVGAASSQSSAISYQRDRTLATWVASNAVAELRLAGEFPREGRRSGQALMGVSTWYWVMDVSATAEPALRRLEVVVGREAGADDGLARLTAYIGQHDVARDSR